MQITHYKASSRMQQGAALVVLAMVIALIASAAMIQYFSKANIRQLKLQKTQQSLATAKQALLAYSTESLDTSATCDLNCARPGDLPCPDNNNDGNSEISCNTQASRLGRLPWKTLGIDDIRDGAGERLWYAVSERFKNNTRILPLNSDTLGTISLKAAQGNLIFDATNSMGLVAVVIAPNEILTRADNLQQNRSANNVSNAQHYLDTINGEDNADFIENSANGFVLGNQSQENMVNDTIIIISKAEINAVMEQRVLTEVMQAMLNHFCKRASDTKIDGNTDIKNRGCKAATSDAFLPDPALMSDASCLGTATIASTHCNANNSVNLGRIPVGGNANWTAVGKGVNSILRGDAQNNWFQQNGWREMIFYARAPACQEATKNCSGAGFLTLNGAVTPIGVPSSLNKKLVLIAGGSMLSTQTRATNLDKTAFSAYIEDENLSPLDDVFARYSADTKKNDRVTSVP